MVLSKGPGLGFAGFFDVIRSKKAGSILYPKNIIVIQSTLNQKERIFHDDSATSIQVIYSRY